MTQDLIANRYRVVKTLHTGRSRTVHLVDDLYASGPSCILKELTNQADDDRALFRFHEEYRLLSDLFHPGLVRPRRLCHETDHSTTFMVEEAAPGCSLQSWGGAVTADFLARLVVHLARVLSYLHARGIVHFDVKPDNIIVDVDEAGSLRGVRLVDFDLMGRAGDETSVRGTPVFMAPEVKESGAAADGRADLYSLGVTLLVLLNGDAEDLPDELTPNVVVHVLKSATDAPDWVEPLILKLIDTEPDKRPNAARDLISMVDPSEQLESPQTRIAPALRPRFVGRAQELARLRNSMPFFQRTEAGAPREALPVVLITGERGVGKTRLLDRYDVSLATSRVGTVRVSPGHGSPVDLQAFVRRVMDAQGALINDDVEQIAERNAAHASAFHATSEVGAGRFGWFDTLALPLLSVPRERPLAVLLDDVHQFDGTSLDFLCFLLRRLANQLRDRSGTSSVQVVMTAVRHRMQPDLVELIRDLAEEGVLGEVSIEPMSSETVESFLNEMSAPDNVPPLCTDWFMGRTHGNPMFVRETFLSLLEAAPESTDFTHAFDQEMLDAAPVAARVRRVVEHRLRRIEPEDRIVLDLLSLHPARADDELLAAASGLSASHVVVVLDRLIRGGLLSRGARGGVRFLDMDALEVVQGELDQRTCRELHDRLAESLGDGASIAGAWALPCHLIEGIDPSQGWGAAYAGWTQLKECSRVERALVICDAVLSCSHEPPRFLRVLAALVGAEICIAKGDVVGAEGRLVHLVAGVVTLGPVQAMLIARIAVSRGQFADARRSLRAAIQKIESHNPRACIELVLFEAYTYLQQRLLKDAAQTLDDAADRLAQVGECPIIDASESDQPLSEIVTPTMGERHSMSEELAVLLRLQGEVAFRGSDLRKALSLSLLAIDIESSVERGVGLTQSLRLAGNSYMVGGEFALAFQHFNRAVALHEEVGDFVGLADTYNNLGILKKKQGKSSDAIDYLLKSLRLRKEIGHREGEIQSYLNIANIHLSRRELAPAARYLNICLNLKRRLSDDANPAIILNSLGAVAELRDRLSAANRYYESAVRADRSFGNISGAVTWQINAATVQLKVGDKEKAERLATRSLRLAIKREMPQQMARSRWILASLQLRAGRTTEALRILNDALEVLGAAGHEGDRVSTLVQMLGVHVARGDDEASHRVLGLIRPLEEGVVSNETELDLLTLELQVADRQNSTRVPRDQIEQLIEHTKNAIRRNMPGAAWKAASALAFHFNGQGDTERAFYYFSAALASFEEAVQAIGDGAMIQTFMQSKVVAKFKQEAQLFIEQHCPGLREEDARLPRDVRTVFQTLKKGFFDVERSMGTTVAHLRRNEEGIRRILEISQTLSSTAPTDDLLVQVVDGVMDFSGAERGFIILIDDDGNIQIPVARSSFREQVMEPERQISHNIINQVMESHRPVLVQNAMDDENYRVRESVINLELRSIMVAPLLRGELLLGMLYVDNRSRVGQFPEEDLELLNIFSTQVAIALENSRLVQEFVRDEKMRIMGMMAGGVAHDFNNLLATIIGRTQLLQKQFPDGEINRDLETVEKAARDGAGVVRRLQDYTRVSRQSDMVVTRVKTLIEDVVEFTRTQWESESFRSGRHIEVKNEVAADLLVACNPSELREVFTNIMLNALAAMPDGGVIRFAADATRERVRIRVIDFGVGMSETTRSNIFDPFFTTRKEEGNGLGMSIVYGILMRHGGAVSVESEAGRGSTIIIELPRATGKLPEVAPPHSPAPSDGGAGSSSLRLLVVDDEDTVRTLLAEILAAAGYTVVQASGGAEALERAAAEPIDCLLTDLGMAPMSGWELAREIKAKYDIPVILVTGWAGEIDATQARENQVDRVISKPFDPDELVNCITALCQ